MREDSPGRGGSRKDATRESSLARIRVRKRARVCMELGDDDDRCKISELAILRVRYKRRKRTEREMQKGEDCKNVKRE